VYLINSYLTLQYMFVLLVLPCLVLAYLGQAAFLIANQKSSEHVFFSSIPSKLDVVEHLACLTSSHGYILITLLQYSNTRCLNQLCSVFFNLSEGLATSTYFMLAFLRRWSFLACFLSGESGCTNCQ
jgi:hypothetical protein